MNQYLFVYGTTPRPGDVRWSFLEPFAADAGVDDTANGTLYDTGLEYPAAVFHGGGTIFGRTYASASRSARRDAGGARQEQDIVLGLYRRVEITTGRGVRAWAYEYGDGLELTPTSRATGSPADHRVGVRQSMGFHRRRTRSSRPPRPRSAVSGVAAVTRTRPSRPPRPRCER